MEKPTQTLDHLSQIEEKAEEVLRDREEIVALDKKRNQNREGLRALKTHDHDKTWVAMGSLLVKMPTKTASEMLQKDQVQLDTTVNKLRSDLKVKVNQLRDLEHQSPVPGLMLNPISKQEMNALGQIWGQRAS